jgi:molybdate transport system substrate-binding protein
MLGRFTVVLVLLSSLLFAKSINIAVAANVSYAIEELVKEFNKTYPDIKVRVTLGSSGKLTAQIKNGAPLEIFMSANMKYPQSLYKDKIATTKPVIYARGTLAFLSIKRQDFSKGMKLLEDKHIRVIAVSNPKTAPYGVAAMEALKNAKVLEKVKHKFVYGESVSQTLSYSVTAADIGLVAKSSLFSPRMSRFKKDINWFDVDKRLYRPIDQGIVIIRDAKSKSEVKAFYDFILDSKAKKVFEDFGYIVP